MTKKRCKKQNNWDKRLLLSWRKLWILVVGGFISIILHNVIYAIFEFEEAFFFIIVIFVIPIYFLISLIYSIIKKLKKGK
ncbi:MAG: hypothetical protein ABIB79_00825 [archaeon]